MMMQTTYNPLPRETERFFRGLSGYLDEPLYFFGSVQRMDYIPGKSDIDVDIFPENDVSTMTKMCHFLKINRKDFKKVVWMIGEETVYGHKLKYERMPPTGSGEPINAEFSVYPARFRALVQKEHLGKFILPFYVTWLLYGLKIVHYQWRLIGEKSYDSAKRFIMTTVLGLPEDRFLTWTAP